MLGPLCLFQNRDCEEEAVTAAPFVAFLCLFVFVIVFVIVIAEAATAAPFVAFPSSCRQSFPPLPPRRPPIIANQEKKQMNRK